MNLPVSPSAFVSTPINTDLDLTLHPSFKLIEHRPIEALSLDVLVCQHEQTGAMHYHLAHPSDENAFMVGFRTQPMTSKGEAHILEHTALCGSKKYPVRDPFFSMIKRSLNTFMNAMTAADWTVYPFATQNRNDFFNLLSVYVDAAFFPNIDPLDFAQEGIRIELDDSGAPQFKGIVFNEMKGAMSGEVDQLYHAVAHHLFPTTTYHYNSGGDPADIPDLTHEELVAFHASHYHPTNSISMSFGNIAIGDIQTRLHEDVFAKFTQGDKHASHLEQRRSAPIAKVETYGVDELTKNQTHHVVAWLLPTITDPKQRLALRLLEGVLIEHAGSPLRAYLDSHALGTAPSPLLGLDDSHFEMVFYTGLRGSEPEHAEAVEQGILELLAQVADNGIDADTIETILHQIEIDQRHIGGDGMPYGLNLMLEGFSTAVHDGNPIDIWQVDEHLAWLREQVQDPEWLPSLLRQHLLDNPHRVRVTLVPDAQKSTQLAKAEQARLDAIAERLTDADKTKLQEQAQALQARQSQPDDLSLLPKVGLEDVPSHIHLAQGESVNLSLAGQSATLHRYEAGTNGLYYHQLVMTLDDGDETNDNTQVADAIINHPFLPLYLNLLAELGTDGLSAREFQAVQASMSSGVTARISQRTATDDPNKISSYFILATRALTRKPEAIDLLKTVLEDTVFTETDRIKELLSQRASAWQARIAGAGHAYAMQTASRGMSKQAGLEYAHSGLPALNALKQFLQDAKQDESAWDKLTASLTELHQMMQALPKQAILVCEPDESERLTQVIEQTWQEDASVKSDKLSSLPDNDSKLPEAFANLKLPNLDNADQDVAWLVPTNVYHNAKVYPAVPIDNADAPALMVLAPYLRNGYLHRAIREQGGAYGGGSSYDANACAFKFFSYRDPHCIDTFAHFDASVQWLISEPQAEEQLGEAILGIISGMDKPASPAGEAVKACLSELHGRDEAWQQQLREQILEVSIDDLKRVAQTYLTGDTNSNACRAVLAPYDKADAVQSMGFAVEKIGS